MVTSPPTVSSGIVFWGHLKVVCVRSVAKNGKKKAKKSGGVWRLMHKGGQTRGDANGDPDAQEYDEQIPSNRVQ